MSMPAFDDAMDRAKDEPAFSNGFECDTWMDRWCYRCVHEENCPLILVAMLGKTSAEWQEQDRGSLGNQYLCPEFSGWLP